jgi:hypothetical protein
VECVLYRMCSLYRRLSLLICAVLGRLSWCVTAADCFVSWQLISDNARSMPHRISGGESKRRGVTVSVNVCGCVISFALLSAIPMKSRREIQELKKYLRFYRYAGKKGREIQELTKYLRPQILFNSYFPTLSCFYSCYKQGYLNGSCSVSVKLFPQMNYSCHTNLCQIFPPPCPPYVFCNLCHSFSEETESLLFSPLLLLAVAASLGLSLTFPSIDTILQLNFTTLFRRTKIILNSTSRNFSRPCSRCAAS